MRNKITRITKTEFLPCFIAAYDNLVIKSNILGGFWGAGLVLFNLEAVVLTLNVRLRTLLVPTVEDGPWQS